MSRAFACQNLSLVEVSSQYYVHPVQTYRRSTENPMSRRQLTEGRGCDRPSLRVEPRGQRVEVKRCHPLSVSSLTRRGAEALPGSLLIEFQRHGTERSRV